MVPSYDSDIRAGSRSIISSMAKTKKQIFPWLRLQILVVNKKIMIPIHDRSFFLLVWWFMPMFLVDFAVFFFLQSLDVKDDEITKKVPMNSPFLLVKSPFLGLQPWKKALRTRCFKAGCSQRRRSFRLPWRKALVKGGRNLQKMTTGWCPSYKSGFNEQN